MPESRLPDFLCIGAQKAGTTTLFGHLAAHPEIFVPPCKEVHFFDNPERYTRGVSFYADHFRDAKPNQMIGEATPAYLFVPEAPERIRSTFATPPKLIAILRHPVDRAFSHYLMSVRNGVEQLSFSEAVRREPDRLTESHQAMIQYSYISRGRYAEQMRRYLDLFGRDRIFTIILEEDFGAQRDETLSRLWAFLGVAHHDIRPPAFENRARERTLVGLEERIIDPPGMWRRTARALIPLPRLRRAILNSVRGHGIAFLRKYAWRPGRNRLPHNLRQQLFDRYFEDETTALEALIDRNLDCWRKTVPKDDPSA